MKRNIEEYLLTWKNRNSRKPLIIRGARQVGKTYTVEKFAKEHFRNFIKINFEEVPELKSIFSSNNIFEIKQNIEIYFGDKLEPKSSLLFLDEIQACKSAIVTLRYFYEKLPELHVIAAGSLLDHALKDTRLSMPVGRVEFAYMYPMDFDEFVLALDEPGLFEFIKNYELNKPVNAAIHAKLLYLLRLYFFIGGMPEAVNTYKLTKNLIDVERIHESILRSLEYDFSKYSSGIKHQLLVKLLNYVPRNICKKFKYVNFDPDERSNVVKESLKLLEMSRVIKLIYSSRAATIPLAQNVNEKVFKPLFFDIGLVNHSMKIRMISIDQLVTANEGALAEQFIGQQLLSKPPYFLENDLLYWLREKKNAEAEVDFITEIKNRIFPIEVKSGKTGTLKSLHIFVAEKNKDVGIRFYTDLPSITDVNTEVFVNKKRQDVRFKLISLPLYLVTELDRLI